MEYGKSAKAPKAPAIKGLRFTGWDKDYKNVTEDMTVTAEYSDSKLIADCEISGFKTHMTFTGYELAQSGITLSYGDTSPMRAKSLKRAWITLFIIRPIVTQDLQK